MALGWDDLIDENSEVKLWVLKSLSRRRCMLRDGCITPAGLREALQFHNDRIPMLIDRKRRELGMPRDIGAPVSGLVIADGFGREA